jgi:transcription factor SPN1
MSICFHNRGPKPGQPGYRQHASRPEALPLDFVVRPLSKIDPEEIRARAKQQRVDERRLKVWLESLLRLFQLF